MLIEAERNVYNVLINWSALTFCNGRSFENDPIHLIRWMVETNEPHPILGSLLLLRCDRCDRNKKAQYEIHEIMCVDLKITAGSKKCDSEITLWGINSTFSDTQGSPFASGLWFWLRMMLNYFQGESFRLKIDRSAFLSSCSYTHL